MITITEVGPRQNQMIWRAPTVLAVLRRIKEYPSPWEQESLSVQQVRQRAWRIELRRVIFVSTRGYPDSIPPGMCPPNDLVGWRSFFQQINASQQLTRASQVTLCHHCFVILRSPKVNHANLSDHQCPPERSSGPDTRHGDRSRRRGDTLRVVDQCTVNKASTGNGPGSTIVSAWQGL